MRDVAFELARLWADQKNVEVHRTQNPIPDTVERVPRKPGHLHDGELELLNE